jgi:hypothetical protein
MKNNNLLSDTEIQRYMELLEQIETLNKLDPDEFIRVFKV